MSGESQFPDGLLEELRFLRRRVAELERLGIERDAPTEGTDLFRRLVEHSLGLMCVHDLEGNLLFVNAAAALTLGFHPEDGVGWNLRRFLSPSVENQFDTYLQRIRDNGVDSGLMRLVAKDGTERIWLYRNVLYEEPGAPPRVLGHAQDVTDRVRAEQALTESERRFRLLAGTAPVLIWMSDAAGRCTFLNQQWLDFTGRGLEDQLGMGWTASIHPEDRDGFVLAYRSAVAARIALRREYRLRRADGEYRFMLTTAVPWTEAEAAFAGLIGICVDVTEERHAHEALEQARDELAILVATRTEELGRSHEQLLAEMRHRARIEQKVAQVRRLESLGVLTGGIAHDLNNLLTVILGRVHLLLDRRGDESSSHDLSLIRRSAERGSRLTQQLLAFGRKQLLEPQPVDLDLPEAGAGGSPDTATSPREPRAPATSPTILLVEEDNDVRLLLRDILRPRGYDVLAARDLEEASALVGRRARPIDLVLSSLATAGTGKATLDRIAADYPGAKLLVLAGNSVHPEVPGDLLEPRTALLPKPFTVMSLLAKVRELLDQPGDLHHDF